ncbi:MAG TPA: class I SAM-dependent methyltransferase [Acidimicrobiales bacterium]|nr:class I SAM-dependent methyltransferase [Acidimicrobiales bacterium]
MTTPAEPRREQRLVFGEVADVYDRQRPSYPSTLVDAVLSFAGLGQSTTTAVAEVGAGTGKASVLFAARDLRLTCVEPSSAMAAVALRNLAPYKNVEVVQTSFEDWQPRPHTYGLLYAAQSWHWVAPQARCTKAFDVLGQEGTLALFWNVLVTRGSDSLERDLEVAYGDLLSDRMRRSHPTERPDANNWVIDEIGASGLFGPVTQVREPWQAIYDTDDWLELISTQSDHRMLDEDTRAGLFDRIRTAVDRNGGQVEVDYLTVAYLAQARDPAGREDHR